MASIIASVVIRDKGAGIACFCPTNPQSKQILKRKPKQAEKADFGACRGYA